MRLAYFKIGREGYQHLVAMSRYLAECGLEATLLNLVYLRVSQINGCPYCVDLHWRDARKAGENEQRLNGVVVWRETPFFSERERAALAWAEAVTRLRDQQVSDQDYENAKRHFTEKELVDLTLAVANMNAFNRMAIAFGHQPAALPPPAAGAA